MTRLRDFCIGFSVSTVAVFAAADHLRAGQTDYCVVCKDPAQTYTCRVNTPDANPGDKALQLYCIIKTAKDGDHRSCKVERKTGVDCIGPVRTYSYRGPDLPKILRPKPGPDAHSNPVSTETAARTEPPARKGEEPDTLVEITGRAVGAGKDGVEATGGAIKNAAGATGKTIGKIGKKAGKQVGKTARGASSAARYAYDCVKSLFRECGGSEEPEPERAQQ